MTDRDFLSGLLPQRNNTPRPRAQRGDKVTSGNDNTTAFLYTMNHRDDHIDDASVDSKYAGPDDNVAIREQELERATLAHKENRAVIRMRGAVFAVLLATSIIVSVKVYHFSHENQKKDFRMAFVADATKVLESFSKNIERRIELVDALSVAVTSHALATQSTFPNVTLPDYAARYAHTRVLTGSVFVNYLPLVTDENRAGWEAYHIANRAQFDQAYQWESAQRAQQDARFNRTETVHRSLDATNTTERPVWATQHDTIVRLQSDGSLGPAPPQSGPYLPLYQTSPSTPTKTLLNIDGLTHPILGGPYRQALATGQAVINVATNLAGAGQTDAFLSLFLSLGQYRYVQSEFKFDPTSAFAYPVFDSFNATQRQVVGIFATNFYWRVYFKNALPANTRGIICVLENNRNQSFTYRLDDDVTFLGQGDLHDPKYDYLEQSNNVASRLESIASPQSVSYTSVSMNEYCSYTLRVFPSQDTEDLHVTWTPFLMTMVILCVFVFTSLIFAWYTVAVKRRQEVVMDRAVASGAIVSSLFPSQVRDQIYQENKADATKASYLTRDGDDQDRKGRPIASLFDKTTIMFADMVGFTSWSAKRQPVQVFELLETLYKAFDTIALRRKVFKVETIGDCYVAVAGLPEPQADHAVIMAKFANECMFKMNQLTTELAHQLGEDTASLSMRVGMHSGPVTGGVLRGQKSRFQLFGDTMNTASRMESNGVPHRIHVSQETADELTAKGKSHWVEPRKDRIVAKGKGELQTFWVTLRSTETSIITSSQDTTNEDARVAKEIMDVKVGKVLVELVEKKKVDIEPYEILNGYILKC